MHYSKSPLALAVTCCLLPLTAAGTESGTHSPALATTQTAAQTTVLAATSDTVTVAEVLVEAKTEQRKTGTFKVDILSSAKFTQPLLDTAQTVSVIPEAVLEQQASATLTEALRNTPGITLQLGEGGNTAAGDSLTLRGYAAQSAIFVDGIRDLAAITRDTFNVGQIEIAKGPAGADIGRGALAGYINLVSKPPARRSGGSGLLAAGSSERTRLTLDAEDTFGDSGAVRVNVMAQDGQGNRI